MLSKPLNLFPEMMQHFLLPPTHTAQATDPEDASFLTSATDTHRQSSVTGRLTYSHLVKLGLPLRPKRLQAREMGEAYHRDYKMPNIVMLGHAFLDYYSKCSFLHPSVPLLTFSLLVKLLITLPGLPKIVLGSRLEAMPRLQTTENSGA